MTIFHLVNHDWLKKGNESGIEFCNLDKEGILSATSPIQSPTMKKEDQKTILAKLDLLLESREDIKEDENFKPVISPSKDMENIQIKKTNTQSPIVKNIGNQTCDLNKFHKTGSINKKIGNLQDNLFTPNTFGNTPGKTIQSNQGKTTQLGPRKLKEESKKSKSIYFNPNKDELKISGKLK